MRSLKHRELAFLLVGSLAATMPAFAKKGSDDGSSNGSSSSSSSTSGTAGTSATSGTAGTSSSSGTSGTTCRIGKNGTKSDCDFMVVDTTSAIKGSFKKTDRKNGSKQKLELKVKVGKNGLITPENFAGEIGVIRAIFPSGAVCELEPVYQYENYYAYLLKAKVSKGVFYDKVGECTPHAMPEVNAGDSVSIEFDEDDDTATTNVEVAKIVF